ncbi:MAG TPA: NmrA family transcriptional regulator, partial [Pseudonocardia sp.]|nr:NmrA family transcriptional regulator [Pseudonocardia sp.]
MNTDTTHETLVTGGTGKTGRRVAQRLRDRGIAVRLGSRAGQPPFDWDDRATWGPALAGVDAVYLAYAPDLAVPGAAETVGAFAGQAVESGARRIVLLSGRGEPEAQQAEKAVTAAAPGATVLRCSFFAQNFSESFLAGPVRAGEVMLPVDTVPEPFVDADDIADVAAAALTEDGHVGEVYELTGPRLL